MIKISYFNQVNDNIPKDYDLDTWLKMTINPPKNLEEEVEAYRNTMDKKLKQKLPCVTISASFNKIRNLENIKQKNKLICIDIDRFAKGKKAKSNNCIDMLLVKELFINHPSTLYTGFSCSGDGVYAILKIYDEEALDEYFELFQEKFANIGINIDNACKDYTRLRFFSVDKEAYYNPNAKAYRKKENALQAKEPVEKAKESKVERITEPRERILERLDNWSKTKIIVEEAERHLIDITSNYQDWIKLAAALHNEFGEDGRESFHRLSKIHPDYKYQDCDEKFNHCKKMNKVSINSLMYIADSYGIRYKK
jgi:hypothetical protein